ncbi:hypothetical protein [Treponema bryantii]|uniref:hypothetical protein n=1 Tax=Treponema bryantii TaxID=163 RepID=UPI002B2F61DD|nr:hypothetical protein TRBR_00460 [Treponema bryantii]
MIRKISFFAFLFILFIFVGCKNSSSDNEPITYTFFEKEEFTNAGITINSISYSGNHYKIYEYNCTYDEDNYYIVNNMKIHYFSATKYIEDENNLINIIQNQSVTPTNIEKVMTVRPVFANVKNSKNEECVLYSTTIIKLQQLVYE